MPTVTCPYCKLQSLSKYLHKKHLRDVHPELHNNNIQTCFTGCQHELVPNVNRNDHLSNTVTAEISKPEPSLTSGTYDGLPFLSIDSVSRADELASRVIAYCKIGGVDCVLSIPAELVILK